MLVAILISCLIHQALLADIEPKCCPEDYEVQEVNNSVLNCLQFTSRRLQVSSKSYNFLGTNDSGECLDSDGRFFYIYNVNGTSLVSKRLSSYKVFTKCCPLHHVYDNETRSCSKSLGTEDFLDENIFQIGLPHCRMITDKTFETSWEATSLANNLTAGNYCIDKNVAGEFLVRECQKRLDICNQKRCFRKCCADGQSYVEGAHCRDTYVHGLKLKSQGYSPYIEDIDDDYEFIYDTGCTYVSVIVTNKIQYSIKKKGEFKYYHNFSQTYKEENYSNSKFCLEHARKGNMFGYYLFQCMDAKPLDAKFANTLWAKILSCICLLLTIVVYFFLGEVKTAFGKILINYCLAVASLLMLLATIHTDRTPSRLQCKIKGYFLIFFNSSAFAWVNIMSIDIWMTFGSPRRTIGRDQRKKDLKKFILYFLYGWGMPLCHTLLILFFESTSILPESLQPYVGIYKCILEERNYSRTVLFLIPQLIFHIINTVLFIKTTVYCIKVKNEIRKMNDSVRTGKINADKERLGLIVKLAVIMGAIWIFEVITSFFTNMKSYSKFTKILEIILDNFTCLQGVFIFIIFICKKKTYESIKKKLGVGERRVSTMSVTQTSNLNGYYPMNSRQTTMSINENKL